MADRMFLPLAGCLEVDIVELFCDVTIGSSGAPSPTAGTSLGYGKGIKTFVRNSAGNYTITLSDRYPKLMYIESKQVAASYDPTAGSSANFVISEAVASATPTIIVQFYKGSDGTALDPASGSRFLFKVTLRNSSVT